MIILWIRKRKTDKNAITEKKERQSFEQHDDIMKRFRLEHPDVNIIDAKDIFADEGNLLVPVQQVKLPVNIQN
ncbi:MAG: hypothetical protein A2Y58_05950 [Chloroflexi bacterium RBG_13_51_52]|nr:MAG: hypothetical protein A2Y58_05950 [Chloroflexi bacterium RBG_13_51_52]